MILNVLCYKTHLLEVLELLIPRQTFLLSHTPVNADRREVLFSQELGESHTSLYRLDENDDLMDSEGS